MKVEDNILAGVLKKNLYFLVENVQNFTIKMNRFIYFVCKSDVNCIIVIITEN